MVDRLLLYISAARDLESERAVLSRAVVEIPTTLAWRIVQSPLHGEPADLEAVARADVHLVLLGSDIRAPIGVEWVAARRVGHHPLLFLKQSAMHTMAAQAFIRHIEEQASWQPFKDIVDLRQQVLQQLADHILERAAHYALSPQELERLSTWKVELEAAQDAHVEETRGGTGDSSVILSRERYIPSQGVLIQPPEVEKEKGALPD